MPALHKYELAERMEVTPRVLSNWLNNLYFKQLRRLGYRKSMKILPPKIVDYMLNEK